MPVPKNIWLLLVAGLEIILVTLYAVSVHLNGGTPSPLLDVDGFRTLPSWLQATQLFLLGALPFWMCINYRNPEVPPSRGLLAFAALFFLCVSIDELFKLNVLLHQHHLWKIIYLSVGVAIPVLFRRDVVRLCHFYPQAMKLIGLGTIVFIVCGFGLDLFRVHVQQPYWYQLFGRWQFYQVDSIRAAFEELGEMLGETLVLKGTLDIAQRRRAQLLIRVSR